MLAREIEIGVKYCISWFVEQATSLSSYGFCSKFHTLSSGAKVWKSKLQSLKAGTFLRHSVDHYWLTIWRWKRQSRYGDEELVEEGDQQMLRVHQVTWSADDDDCMMSLTFSYTVIPAHTVYIHPHDSHMQMLLLQVYTTIHCLQLHWHQSRCGSRETYLGGHCPLEIETRVASVPSPAN